MNKKKSEIHNLCSRPHPTPPIIITPPLSFFPPTHRSTLPPSFLAFLLSVSFTFISFFFLYQIYISI